MTPEELMAAIEKDHREHEARLKQFEEWKIETMRAIFAEFTKVLTPPVPSPMAVERSCVRNHFAEACAVIDELKNLGYESGFLSWTNK
jgi:hypothetical protein